MLSSLANGLGDAIIALADRPCRVWLRNATKESVLDGLKVELFKGISEFGPVSRNSQSELKRVFKQYGTINAADHERYWTEKELASFLQSHFNKPLVSTLLTRSIRILWRCFRFHAYFPFPELSPDKIDGAAFIRAMGLLASGGFSRLGCDWFGNYTTPREGDSDLILSDMGRLLRSLAIPVALREGNDQTAKGSQVEDLLDVLTLVHPPSVPYGSTTQEELRDHANKILSSTKPYNFCSIPREESLSLITLLLTLRQDGRLAGGPLGVQDERTSERLARGILRRCAPDEDSDIHFGQLQRDFESLFSEKINLPTQMSLIFNGGKFERFGTDVKQPNATSPTLYAQYLGLLNPPYTKPNKISAGRCLNLQNPDLELIYSATSTTLSASGFASVLAPKLKSTFLLLTANDEPPEISRLGASHGLFQLEPTLQILRPIRPQSLSANMISLDTAAGTLRFGKEVESGLFVDFKNRSAILRYVTKSSGTEDANANKDEYRDTGNAKEQWETTMRIQNLGLYESQGAPRPTYEELGGEEYAEAVRLQKHQVAEAERLAREAGLKVTGEDLRRRIQGIGPRQDGEGIA